MGRIDRHLGGEEGVRGGQDLGREDGEPPPVQAPHLRAGVAHGGRGGHDERPHGARPPVGAGEPPCGHGVHGHLEQAHSGAQGTGDEVELVLDDEVGRAQAAGGDHAGGRHAVLGGVGVLDLAGVVVAGAPRIQLGDVAVALAAPGHVPEEGGGLPLAGQAGELVHGGDDEGGDEPVDLLIGGQHRDAVGHGTALGEGAGGQGVRAVDAHAPLGGLHPHVLVGQRVPAPGAAGDLEGRVGGGLPGAAVLERLQLLGGLGHPFGRDGAAHPQSDPEGLAPPGAGILAAGHLGGADQGGGALELLGGEQPQCVAHEDGDPGAPVQGAVGGCQDALEAADGEGVGGQPQVGLGLAAAGGEEEQLHLGPLRIRAPGQGGFGQGRELQEHEGELEDAPVVGEGLGAHALLGLSQGQAGFLLALLGDLGVDALVGHDAVHEGEAALGV